MYEAHAIDAIKIIILSSEESCEEIIAPAARAQCES